MLEKGLPGEVVDRVGGRVQRSGTMREMLGALAWDVALTRNKSLVEGVAEMELLASYLEAMEVIDKVTFDLSLARGLDYYTGLIYEVVPDRTSQPTTQVGSIAAGGRYDGLVGMYGRRPLPCIGVSFGVDRIFTILDARREKKSGSDLASRTDVYIMAFGGKDFDGLLLERMRVARQLWNAGIRAEFTAKVKPKPVQQFNSSKGVPAAVIVGREELEAGQVRVKRLHLGPKNEDLKEKGQLILRENLVEEVKRLLASPSSRQGY
ncbi:hypothetical protein C8A03DRAFT_35477 [Achaetomium macrosporum]|uniref:histidine--tRNA ligase n=1 Tax=Achaetomium macrosporum TaxID=79813 RepID=A0AAN7C814_9PEZI|nr:hypothetical protein C8A03DRAFT_35477 [Achaetomium macrosporum]